MIPHGCTRLASARDAVGGSLDLHETLLTPHLELA